MGRFLLLALCVLASPLAAADVLWDGGASTLNWSDAANWSTDAVPSTGDTAVFDGSVVPGGPVIFTGGSAGDAIRVEGPATVSIIIDLAGNFNLAGASGWSIQVGVSDSLAFTAASAGPNVATQDNINIAAGGTLSLDANCMLSVAAATAKALTVGNGASFLVGGTFYVTDDYEIDADSSGGATVVTLNNVDIDGSTDLTWDINGGADVDLTINGDIRALGNDAHFDMWSLLDGGNDVFLIDFAGNFDANGFSLFRVEGDYGYWMLSGTQAFVTGTGGTFDDAFFGELRVPAGTSLAAPDGAFGAAQNRRIGMYSLVLGGTFDAGSNELRFLGSLFQADGVIMDVGAGATFTQTGDVVIGHDSVFTATLTGAIDFGGNVDIVGVPGARNLVALGSTVTIAGDLHVLGGAFGADEDGATVTATPATITFNGNVRVDPTNGLIFGEGIHRFHGDLDLGKTSGKPNVTVWPDVSQNDFEVEIYLTSNSADLALYQTIEFEPGTGSAFAVSGVLPRTGVIVRGCMQAGWLDFSSINGGFLDGGGVADIVFGGAVATRRPRDLMIGAGNMTLRDVTVRELSNPAGADDDVTVNFRTVFVDDSYGQYIMESLTVMGDDSDDFAGAEANGGTVRVFGGQFRADALEIRDGSGGGRGACFEMFDLDSSARANDITVGSGTATDAAEGADFRCKNAAWVIFGTLGVGPNCSISLNRFSVDSSFGYIVDVDPAAESCTLLDCGLVTSDGSQSTVRLGGTVMSAIRTIFSGCDADGVQIAAGSTITALAENQFRSGASGGTHLTLNGVANATTLNCDGNRFDGSTGVSGHALVTATGTNRLKFRQIPGQGFGIDAFVIDAAIAELRDSDDGTNPAAQVTWAIVPARLVIEPLYFFGAGITYDTTPNQAAAHFYLFAYTGDTTVTSITFAFVTTGELTAADIESATLFKDADGDCQFDSGEEISLDQAVSGGVVTFNVPGIAIASETSPVWSVAITLAPSATGKSGQIAPFFPFGGVGVADPDGRIVLGLPLEYENLLPIIAQPHTGAANEVLAAAVVEVRDSQGNPVVGRAVTVTVELHSPGSGLLTGTLSVNSNPANGRATFNDLVITQPGTNYRLRFTTEVLAADSDTIEITGVVTPPGGGGGGGGGNDGGGGCAVVQSASAAGHWIILGLLLTIMSPGIALRARRP